MDILTKALLTGAAVGALAVSPALAGPPHFHAFAAMQTKNGLKLKEGIVHYKTDVRNPGAASATATATFTYTGNPTTMYNKYIFLGYGTTWVTTTKNAPNVCKTIHPQRGYSKRKEQNPGHNAVIKQHHSMQHVTISETTGFHCTGTVTFFGPDYRLLNTDKKKNTFIFKDVAKHKGDSMTFIQNWTVNFD